MKAGWEVKPLGDVIDLISGQHIDASDYNTDGRGIAYLTGPSDFGAVYPIISRWTEKPKKFAKSGDVLLTVKGSGVGKTNLLDIDEVAISRQIMAVRAKNIEPRFLHLVLQSLQQHFASLSNGAAIPGISRTDVTNYQIPLPPLEEQQRIVAVLDEAFEGLTRARAHAEANLQNARELFAGAIAQEFASTVDTPRRKVGDVAHHSLGKMLDKSKNKGSPRGYLRNLNVRWFEFDTSDILEMRIEDHEIERYSVKRGDLLICEGGYPGRCAVWDQGEAMFYQKALHRVRFDHEVYGRLLMFFLFMEDQSGSLKSNFSGSGIQHFTGQALARYEMPYPPPLMAEAMVARIEAMQSSSRELEEGYLAKLKSLDALRQSLLQKAFSGELT